jgi:hypothetical protein
VTPDSTNVTSYKILITEYTPWSIIKIR